MSVRGSKVRSFQLNLNTLRRKFMADTLGDYCKTLERVETARQFPRDCPVYIRIDGAGFSRFTKGMDRPFDKRMSAAMVTTARALLEDYPGLLAYTQSDEISLGYYNPLGEIPFDGKAMKITSRFAAAATSHFTRIAYKEGLESYVSARPPQFDCRAFSVPTLVDLAKLFMWREIDARKNAIQMLAQSVMSHQQLHGMHGDAQLSLLKDRGFDFESYPECFRRGTFLHRKTTLRRLTDDELSRIPEAHRPTEPVFRSSIEQLYVPMLKTLKNEDLVGTLFEHS
jgi:tRNA(His) guanylyltransferase